MRGIASICPRRVFSHLGTMALALAFIGCGAPQRSEATSSSASASALTVVSSNPSPGATVEPPVDELVLQFSRPALLIEVAVSGPDGLMPLMVHPAGETLRYSIPLPSLEAGPYDVRWRASAAGREYSGTVSFNVR